MQSGSPLVKATESLLRPGREIAVAVAEKLDNNTIIFRQYETLSDYIADKQEPCRVIQRSPVKPAPKPKSVSIYFDDSDDSEGEESVASTVAGETVESEENEPVSEEQPNKRPRIEESSTTISSATASPQTSRHRNPTNRAGTPTRSDSGHTYDHLVDGKNPNRIEGGKRAARARGLHVHDEDERSEDKPKHPVGEKSEDGKSINRIEGGKKGALTKGQHLHEKDVHHAGPPTQNDSGHTYDNLVEGKNPNRVEGGKKAALTRGLQVHDDDESSKEQHHHKNINRVEASKRTASEAGHDEMARRGRAGGLSRNTSSPNPSSSS